MLILTNTYILADYHFDESESEAKVKEIMDSFFVASFTIELILKLVGLGCKHFFADKFNIFDAIIVVISLLEVILSQLPSDIISP